MAKRDKGIEAAHTAVESSAFRFRADEIARALDKARPDPDGLAGARVELPAPEMPTMGLAVERMPAGFACRRQRSTASRCLVVMSGSGSSIVGGREIAWSRGDTIAIPTWVWFEHRAATDAQVFHLSDEPLMRLCNYHRQEAQ